VRYCLDCEQNTLIFNLYLNKLRFVHTSSAYQNWTKIQKKKKKKKKKDCHLNLSNSSPKFLEMKVTDISPDDKHLSDKIFCLQ